MRLIGLAGKARCGKDTAGSYLSNCYGLKTYAFAKPIKDMAKALGLTEDQVNGALKEAPDSKLLVSPRHIMQTLGTDWGRKMIGEDIWLGVAAKVWHDLKDTYQEHFCGGMVITDVRFDNEARWIKDHGGVVVQVNREKAQEVQGHASENGINHELIDYVVDNNDSFRHLHLQLDDIWHKTVAMDLTPRMKRGAVA